MSSSFPATRLPIDHNKSVENVSRFFFFLIGAEPTHVNSIIIENVASVGGSSFFVDVHDPFTCACAAVLVFFLLISGEGVIGVGMTSTTDAVVCFATDSGNE